MDEHGLKQRQMAITAGVSQSTVSRALKGATLRRGQARSRLCRFVGVNESEATTDPAKPSERVLAAFYRIWDHTEAHADAIAQVIDALGALRPPSQLGEVGGDIDELR